MTSSLLSPSSATSNTNSHLTLPYPITAKALLTLEERFTALSDTYARLSLQYDAPAARQDGLVGIALQLRTELSKQTITLVELQDRVHAPRSEAKTYHDGNTSSADEQGDRNETEISASRTRKKSCTATACNIESDSNPSHHQTLGLLSLALSSSATKKHPRLVLWSPPKADEEEEATSDKAAQGQVNKGRRAKRSMSSPSVEAPAKQTKAKRLKV